jgi:MoaA/NifB/PqqE/SkfB family radical SAM enzyme
MKKYLDILKTILFLPKEVKTFPRHIQIDVTTYCNLRCRMCNSKKIISPNENNVHLSFEKFKHIVDTIKPISVNLAANGEPFFNPEIFKMLDYAKEKHIKTITSTNFILSKEIVNKIANSGLDILKISIDGAKKETYENVRGKYFDILIENINFLNSIKHNLRKATPKLRFDFVIMKNNYKEIVDYIDFAKQFEVESVYFHPIDSREYTEEQKKDIIENIDFSFLKQILKEAKKVAKRYKIRTNIDGLLNNFDIVKEMYLQNGKKLRNKICVLPWLGLFVSITGELSPCCAMYPDKRKSLGNIFNDNFKKIWNGPQLVNMRLECKKKVNYDKYIDCRSCLPMDILTIIDSMKTFPDYIKKYFKGMNNV